MNAQTPPGSRAADAFLPLPTSEVEGASVGIPANGATWDSTIVSSEGVTRDESRHHPATRISSHKYQRPRSLSMAERDIAEDLVEYLKSHVKDMPEYQNEAQIEELADAYRHAARLPPITKQSLSELDIQNIISNIKLRHDVNFDKDLSFRPNNEGSKGQQKERHSRMYWLALEAELHLYTRLFQGTPPLRSSGHADPSVYFQRAQKRVPKVFETIHDVLKSLVPDRDHQRVDEHLDVRMLMQEIEKGVCDMVALVEWTARLLKEHCAPMRDEWVDKMVGLMRKGATGTTLNMKIIVESLKGLIGMLETMKLDVANHQIRNLKPLLIEDTISYEKHYHLDRIVKKRSKVNFEAAQRWWANVVERLQVHHAPATKPVNRTGLDMFAQAVVSNAFSRDTRQELPDTFYLDYDRLRALKSEIEDLVHFEICFSMFNKLRKDLGHDVALSNAARHRLRSSLTAIMGESIGHGSQAWIYNSESLSLEIYRQAQVMAGRSPIFGHHSLQATNEYLRSLFYNTFTSHASTMEATLLPQVLSSIHKHSNSSPTELYNSLVTLPPPTSTPPFIPAPPTVDTFSFYNNTPQDRLCDLARRISHIVLLHWRIWAPITYVQDDASGFVTYLPMPPPPPPQPAITTSTIPQSASPPPPAPICPPPTSEHDVQVVSVMKTGDAPDPGSGYESSVSDHTRLP
ncbi:cAMP-mediated signaling protein sok1 (T-complex protein 11) [Paraphaeosphaeria sporulosa]